MHGLIHIVIWLIHLVNWLLQNKVTRSASVVKKVPCENCGLSYEYEMRRTATVRGSESKESLGRKAEQRLRKRLAEESDLVPCPACGWHQRHMIELVRRNATRYAPAWLVVLPLASIALLLIGLLMVIARQRPDSVARVGTAILAVGAAGLLIFVLFVVRQLYRRLAYNPNARLWKNEPHDQ